MSDDLVWKRKKVNKKGRAKGSVITDVKRELKEANRQDRT